MAKKMTLSGYLAQRGTKAKALTRGEATLLGIPFPLQAGWPRRYSAIEIDEALLEQLEACAEVARRTAEQKVQRAMTERAPGPAALQFTLPATNGPVVVRVVSGFVLRRAKRYRKQGPAPYA